MSAGKDTAWGSAVGEEVWAGSGVEVEGAELPTFSDAAKVRVGVTIVLFVSFAGRNLAVLWSVTGPQPSQLRPSPVRILFAHLAAADLLVTFVVMPLDATWNVTVQWLAGDIPRPTLRFLKLTAVYAAAFLPVVLGSTARRQYSSLLGPVQVEGNFWGQPGDLVSCLPCPSCSCFTLSTELAQSPSVCHQMELQGSMARNHL